MPEIGTKFISSPIINFIFGVFFLSFIFLTILDQKMYMWTNLNSISLYTLQLRSKKEVYFWLGCSIFWLVFKIFWEGCCFWKKLNQELKIELTNINNQFFLIVLVDFFIVFYFYTITFSINFFTKFTKKILAFYGGIFVETFDTHEQIFN